MKKYIALFLLYSIVSGCEKAETKDNFNTDILPFAGWVYEGDSITDLSSGFAFNYPYQLTLLSSSIAKVPQINVAHAGDEIASMIGDYASQVRPHKPKESNSSYAFALMAGTNDAAAGRSSAQIYRDLKKEWSMARDDGFKVIAFCITRSILLARDTVALNVNKLIVADPSQYDYLIRTDLVLPDPGNPLYFLDGIHPTPVGSAEIAKEVVKVCRVK